MAKVVVHWRREITDPTFPSLKIGDGNVAIQHLGGGGSTGAIRLTAKDCDYFIPCDLIWYVRRPKEDQP